MSGTTLDDVKMQFEQFLSCISRVLVHEERIHIAQNKLRRHFDTTSSSYLCSAEFQSLLDGTRSLFEKEERSTKYFTLLSSFDEQLKKHRLGSVRSPLSPITTGEAAPSALSTNTESVIISSNCSTTTAISLEQPVGQQLESHNSLSGAPNRERKIEKLKRRLSNLAKTIRRLEEQDMSLEEMLHCDLYQVESNLKKRALEVYDKLAELQDQPRSIQRILNQPIVLTEMDVGYPSIHQALEEMVNHTKHLPSFGDVLDTVEKTNDKEQLHMNADDQRTLATKLFKLIGVKVKERRMADFHDIMTSRLPESFDIEQNDPALRSAELEHTLVENEREAVMKTEKMLEEFSQIDPELETEDNIDASEESMIESEKDEAESESELDIEPTNQKSENTYYDVVDILPPFSSQSPNEVTIEEESTDKVPLEDSSITILTTASLPLRTEACHSPSTMPKETEPDIHIILDETDTQESQPIVIVEERRVTTLMPRRRKAAPKQKTMYDYYSKEISRTTSSVVHKRPTSKDQHCSDAKKRKEQAEIVILE